MFESAKWIAWSDPELGPWKSERYSKDKEESYKCTITVESGSYVFRKNIEIDTGLKSASLSVCGLGYYEAFLDGEKIEHDRVLMPVVSDYYRLVRYDTYDITAQLTVGGHVLAVEICGGWFGPEKKYWGWQQSFYGNPRMIAQLTLTYADGRTTVVVSDPSWLCCPGAVVSSDIYDGETVDFGRLPADWCALTFKSNGWKNAVEALAPTENLCASDTPAVKLCKTLFPQKSWNLSDTEIVYDFGENGAAMPYVKVQGQAGSTIVLRHAEYIHEDGTLDVGSQNRALSTDRFTLCSTVPQMCHPRFTWHGYRYLMVRVSSPQVRILSVESRIIHSDLQTMGTFRCGSEQINRMHEVFLRTQLACLQGVPVDCPQRDERKAWLGDAHVTSELCFYNFNMQEFYRSFLEDMKVGRHAVTKVIPFICPDSSNDTTVVNMETSSIDWNIAYPIILSEYDARYADTALLAHHYDTLKEHVMYYASRCQDGFVPSCWFGDWLTTDNGGRQYAFESGPDDHRQNPPFAATLFYCKTLRLAAEIAEHLGYSQDAAMFRRFREESRMALLRKYYDPLSGKLGSGGQFLSLFALSEQLVPAEDRPMVFGLLL